MDKTEEVSTKDKSEATNLSKKERRALKVQTKQLTNANNQFQVHDAIVNQESKENKLLKQGNKIQNLSDNKSHSMPKEFTEKEQRKLEWEKKVAEKKLKDQNVKATFSKAELKAIRREQQEAQRLAKVSNKVEETKKTETVNKLQPLRSEKKLEVKKQQVESEPKRVSQVHKVQLVQHLYVEDSFKSLSKSCLQKDVHPAFVRLGIQFMNKSILGSNARCLALLNALKHLVDDIQTPPKQEYLRYLEVVLQTCTNYLQNCRPLAVSMTNALRHFKMQVTQIDTKYTDNEKRARLQDVIDTYIHDDIRKAGDAISLKVNEKITNGDVILTYGCSSLIRKILLDAHYDGKKFDVIIVDGRPFLEGREMLRRLVVAGVRCTYVLINALSYVMSSVTKVVLGAHALLTNGYVMSRIGTAQIALVAQAYNKPVLVCCETYKFSERVQTDSFVYNEVDDPQVLSNTHIINEPSPISRWKTMNKLTPLNLLYDVTPPDLVTAVVTELAILPCTSVPVVLRINANEFT